MIDHQRVVDELRSFCQGSDQTVSDEIREAAAAYREACVAVNARLRRCGEYLAKGLRSEAIQLAESEPHLLGELATLDFPERPQWDQLAAMCGLQPAPKLQAGTAEALNRAYAEEQPLQQLLAQHRRLALARAPIAERLDQLRKLRTADPSNDVWLDDVREFERARLNQLSAEIDGVLGRSDAAGIARVWTELRETQWVDGVPEKHVNRLKGAFLKQVADELHAAVAGQRLERALAARDKLLRLEADHLLEPNDPARLRVKSDLAWVARQENAQIRQLGFQDKLAEFENAVREGTDDETLRGLWLELGEFRAPIPHEIEQLYFQIREDAQTQRANREKLILAAVFGAGVLVLGALFIWFLVGPKVSLRRPDLFEGKAPVVKRRFTI